MVIMIGEAPPPLCWAWPYLSGLSWGARCEGDPVPISYGGTTIPKAVGELVVKMFYRETDPLHSLTSAGIAKDKLAELFPSNKSWEELGKYCIEHASELGLRFVFDEGLVLGIGFTRQRQRPLLPSDLERRFT
ncbi:MAG: hypothetical protein Q7R67_00265 [bacterium]|nr:hypothetical protein [bacterium]